MFYKFFSQRQRGEDVPDVLQYDDLPVEFRNQFMYILSDVCNSANDELAMFLAKQYCREKGFRKLGRYVIHDSNTAFQALEEYVEKSTDDELLDLIDFICSRLNWLISSQNFTRYLLYETPNVIRHAFVELNGRFKQHNLGYEVTKGQLMRIDNQTVHAQYVKPALQLLCDEEFAGAEEEYRNAFEARRAGNNKDAILNAGKCFESVMKIICRKKYNADVDNCAAGALLDKLEQKEFFPKYMNKHFEKIVDTLRFGVPTVRNKVAGHGQGSEITEAPDYLVDYVLGLVAVNSVLLVKLYKESN